MNSALAWIRRRTFGVSTERVLAPLTRAALAPGPGRHRLEAIVATFMRGYAAALAVWNLDELEARLVEIQAPMRGFAYEGAAMAVHLTDGFATRKHRRFESFLGGAGDPHAYMLHIGAGWALARRAQSIAPYLDAHPLLGWLAVDGYGFHETFFHSERYHQQQRRPDLKGAGPYAERAFDQGLGRCLWFLVGTDARRAAEAILGFAADRQPDLWSGIGLACAYAGGGDAEQLDWLALRAGTAAEHFAQGVAFAVAARERAGNPCEHTSMSCVTVWGAPTKHVVALVDEARMGAVARGAEPAYERWRANVRVAFQRREERKRVLPA